MRIVRNLRCQSGFSPQDVAEYLGIGINEYNRLEKDSSLLSREQLESLAALYHVEELDIMESLAVSRTVRKSPRLEKELIPFFLIVDNYIKIERLLNGKNNEGYE